MYTLGFRRSNLSQKINKYEVYKKSFLLLNNISYW